MQHIDKIDLKRWVEECAPEMLEKAKELIRIPSISVFDPDNKEAPFGQECSDVLDLALSICRSYGFETINYDNYGGAAILPGETDDRIGIFVHLDVVPASGEWSFDPFQPFVKNGYLFGRGSIDNKGACMASLFSLIYLKKFCKKLKHTIVLFFGCNEEAGMLDVEHYLQCEKAPVFSYTADSGFPVCNGEKGILEAELKTTIRDGDLIEIHSGQASNIIPSDAQCTFKCSDEKIRSLPDTPDIVIERVEDNIFKVSAKGVAGHAAFPEKADSAQIKLLKYLVDNALIGGDAGRAIEGLYHMFSDCYGKGLDIDLRDDASLNTTHIGGILRGDAHEISQNINVRYAVTARPDDVERRIRQSAAKEGFETEVISNSAPSYFDGEHPVIKTMTRIVNDVLDTDIQPFTMGGGTYARNIPNAVGFGPNRMDLPFPKGIGDGHQADEGMSIQALKDGICIYVQTLLEIDEIL